MAVKESGRAVGARMSELLGAEAGVAERLGERRRSVLGIVSITADHVHQAIGQHLLREAARGAAEVARERAGGELRSAARLHQLGQQGGC